MSDKCEVCNGSGQYPIITRTGRELYSISCPECFSDGLAPEVILDVFEYPPSTASKVKTVDEMREAAGS